MHTSVQLETPCEIINVVPLNPLISKCQIKVCYVGDDPNRNKSVITKEVAKQMAAETIDQCLLPIETAVEQFPRIDLSDELYQKVKNGMRLHKKELGIKAMPESLVALFYQNQVVSLYMPHPTHDKLLKPSKVLRNN